MVFFYGLLMCVCIVCECVVYCVLLCYYVFVIIDYLFFDVFLIGVKFDIVCIIIIKVFSLDDGCFVKYFIG